MPQISIIIPVYNVAQYLRECLDSVLNQSFRDFEIICINDGSTDTSGEILEEYLKIEPRLKAIKQHNQGLSNARNKGLQLAQGDYVLFIDSDDAIHPQLLECTLYLAKKHLADIVNFQYSRNEKFLKNNFKDIDGNNIKYKITNEPMAYYHKKSRYIFRDYAWSKLFRKDFLGKINFIEDINFEDIPFTYSIMKKRPLVILLKEKLYFYRHNQHSITKNIKPKHIFDRHAGLNIILKEYKNSPDLNKVKHTLFRHLLEQYKDISTLNKTEQKPYWNIFQNELIELNSYNVIKKEYMPLKFVIIFKKLVLQKKIHDYFNH